MNRRHQFSGSHELRKKAEKEYLQRERSVETIEESKRIRHELEVHQIELEMQNEELQATRRDAESGLHRYTELFDFAPVGYLVIAEDGNIREVNLAGARLLGLERQRAIGGAIQKYFPQSQRQFLNGFLDRLTDSERRDDNVGSCELTIVSVQGVEREVKLTATSLEGKPLALLCAIEDITERKQAEKALRDEIERKDAFLATLSHELRNPLAPIESSLYILEHVPPHEKPARQARQILSRQVAHLTKLLDDLLDITRIAHNKVQLQKEQLNLNDEVDRAVEDNRAAFEQAGVALHFEPAPVPVYTQADATRILQVVGNLLRNAAKFTPAGGNAHVSVSVLGDEAVVRVSDDGRGMEPATVANLFLPFVQANQAPGCNDGGLGLGLALVKGLVELHGGRVSARSEGIGRGSEFALYLPVDRSEVQRADTAPTVSSRIPRRILIIEDNADAADSLMDALTVLADHDVEIAYGGAEGLEKARKKKPEIVLCDIGLPGMDGYEVARAFRADNLLNDVYLVALSGYARPSDRQQAVTAGFNKHIPKPPSVAKLEEVLQSLPG